MVDFSLFYVASFLGFDFWFVERNVGFCLIWGSDCVWTYFMRLGLGVEIV